MCFYLPQAALDWNKLTKVETSGFSLKQIDLGYKGRLAWFGNELIQGIKCPATCACKCLLQIIITCLGWCSRTNVWTWVQELVLTLIILVGYWNHSVIMFSTCLSFVFYLTFFSILFFSNYWFLSLTAWFLSQWRPWSSLLSTSTYIHAGKKRNRKK